MNHPRMTSSGRRWAFLIGIVIAFALPKRIECGFPDAQCMTVVDREQCTMYEVEPWGFYLIEKLAGSNVGFAYKRAVECR